MARTTKKTPVSNCTWQVATTSELPVYITGSTQELGEWNTNKALQMQHGGRGQDANHWNINLTLPRGQAMEFKFVHKTDDGNVVWEEGDNRYFTAEDGEASVEWGHFRYS
jgi:hypothetical protein